MSSVKRRIIIEEYINGGFGIFDFNEEEQVKEVMGLSNWVEVKEELNNFIHNRYLNERKDAQ